MQAPDWKGSGFMLAVLLIALPFGVWKIASLVWYVISHLQWVN